MNEKEQEVQMETEETEEETTLSPFDTLMLRYSELDMVMKELGVEGAIRIGAQGRLPRYVIRRPEWPDNSRELSILPREVGENGSALYVLVGRVPLRDRPVEEAYEILSDVLSDSGTTAFAIDEEDRVFLLKSSLAVGGETLRTTQLRRLLEGQNADEALLMKHL